MTARQMQREFELFARIKANNLDVDFDGRILTKDFNTLINEAQSIFINKRLTNFSNNTEDTQKELDELQNIIIRNTALSTSGSSGDILFYDLPVDYLYLLDARIISTKCAIQKEYKGRVIKNQNVYDALNNKYTKTQRDSPVVTLTNKKLHAFQITGDFIINNVNIDYVKIPNVIDALANVDCELDQNTHKEIVQTAVFLFLEDSNMIKNKADKNMLTEQLN